jgi:lipoprotein NlpD
MHGGYSSARPNALRSLTRYSRQAVLALGVLAVLAGCGTKGSRAPVTDMSAPSQAPASGTYVVRAGDTLYKIAQMHGTSVANLTRLNNITDPTQLRVGQVLRLDGSTPMPSQPAAVATAPVAPATPVTPPPPTTAARASDATLISWGWPASGKVIQGFNANTKGIDIEGAPGDPVVAAADGKVMYAGNGVRGLGNLVLLGHSNGFITAYAHNQQLLVKTGDAVKKGNRIALLGQTDTSSPRLHFEIRKSGTPVNPLSYLPAR